MSTQYTLIFFYLVGVVTECLSLFKRRPQKSYVISFVIFAGLVTVMFAIPMIQQPKIVPEELFSLGFAISFAVVACFIRDILRTLTRPLIYSFTISFWLLLVANAHYLGETGLIILGSIGVLGTLLSALTLFKIITPRNIHKVLLYGWFLFINGLFAILYYLRLQPDFRYSLELNQGILVGQSYVGMFLFGMTLVSTFASVGVLYYSLIFFFSKDVRKQLSNFIPEVFDDRPISRNEWWLIPLLQIGLFFIFFTIKGIFGFHVLAFFILFGPKLQWAYNRLWLKK